MADKAKVLKQIEDINLLLKTELNVILNDNGRKNFLKLIKDHTYDKVMEALKISINQYFVLGDDNSIDTVFKKLDGILYNIELQKEKPEIANINYLLKIAKNRFGLSGLYYHNIKNILLNNYKIKDYESIKDIFCNYSGYTPLKEQLEIYYGKE